MSGVAVIRYLLANAAAITAKVPAARIMAGDLPLGISFPAIGITQISSMPYVPVGVNGNLHTDRVQVTVFDKGPHGNPAGDGYPGVKTILALLLAACPNQHDTVNGISVDSIIPDIEGPDLADLETDLYSGSRDFLVKWSA